MERGVSSALDVWVMEKSQFSSQIADVLIVKEWV